MRRAAPLALLVACGQGPAAAPADPPAEQQCANARMGWDCWLPVPGGAFRMGAQASDPAGPGYDASATAVNPGAHSNAT